MIINGAFGETRTITKTAATTAKMLTVRESWCEVDRASSVITITKPITFEIRMLFRFVLVLDSKV